MIDAYADSPALTDEQRAVVDRPWDARVLVTAGAGSGKTHTLVRRLDALVGHEEEALEAGEILVLSFSRAAVRELRHRIATHGHRARRVRVQTFDSWAYALLAQAYPDEEWGRRTFDERIREATRAIEKGAVEAGETGGPSHVVIDEVQDLVGDRRNMVETLLDQFQDSCGFTVVGDSAQSIYGFQIDDPEARAAEVDYFLTWLRNSYPDDLVELHLTENFRAETPDARTALSLGPEIQRLGPADADKEGERLYRELCGRLSVLPDLGFLDDTSTLTALQVYPDTCAILTRDNRQALAVSELFASHGVDHSLKRSLRDRPVPFWVAELLRRAGAPTLAEARFLEIVADIPLPDDTDPAQVWRSLRGVARGPRGFLELDGVRRAVADGRFPDELAPPESSRLVVSTVHRAKGLEYDRVILLTPPTLAELRKQHTVLDPAAEARALYVAMTRPRADLCHVRPPDTARIRRERRTDRFYKGGWKAHQRYGIAAADRDVSREEPPGADMPGATALSVQEYLLEHVRPGNEITLRLRHEMPMGPDQSPPYGLHHRGHEIGEVSESFRRDLYAVEKISRNWEVSWPVEITGLRVGCLETVAGSAAAGIRAGLGDHGVWMVPRLDGLGSYRRASGADQGDEKA
ncbi:hypothetical protein GCM10010372_47280 [Streptomyces tauricus]|uniref:DNA 3'-5' helicase n=1 Tax=Streptomyces tauricus TaxID=68274 RepID=A0ABZ1JMK9_9ACTN|nr:UvrD-helicase domain-containing protein [Streptomyces tauricus]GHA41616.1 hypothetical protein GCM10010372_47280 [Streptomyces tauricus]